MHKPVRPGLPHLVIAASAKLQHYTYHAGCTPSTRSTHSYPPTTIVAISDSTQCSPSTALEPPGLLAELLPLLLPVVMALYMPLLLLLLTWEAVAAVVHSFLNLVLSPGRSGKSVRGKPA